MRVLVTGGTGVIGTAAVDALIENGHRVRLFSRNAEDDAANWPAGVDPYPGDVTSPEELEGAAEDCEAVLHIVGVISESPPEVTFERVNVDGTSNVVAEAERAGARRLVFVSSLGAGSGKSPYHRSKRAAEEVVRVFDGEWTILRAGNVFGPEDSVSTVVLEMVRTLPTIPLIGTGEEPFQPIWHRDLGRALALAVDRDDVAGRTLEIAGEEVITLDELVDRFSAITDRSPGRFHVPGGLAKLGAKAAAAVGIHLPVESGQITMLEEGNFIGRAEENALTSVFGITPTPLDAALADLADSLEEQVPSEGVGAVRHKRFRVEIRDSRMSAFELCEHFCEHFNDFLPIPADAGVKPGDRLELDRTVTLDLPLRGKVQVRVEELERDRLTLITISGHPLAGAVRFMFQDRDDEVLFTIELWDRAANILDFVAVNTVGEIPQNANWKTVAKRVVEASQGTAPDGVQQHSSRLEEDQAEEIERWLDRLVEGRKRRERGGSGEE